ncbi:17.7 kDa class I heat shock protein-like [Carica papaya]|uniref:17.7 kDa class I heat shock protein-like n=1 Tax=Carica papaya TaxID=3649 RepID=UPI000B8CEFBF|nr:17.7 kDa class I heat shock protein-like [Carica papaya]
MSSFNLFFCRSRKFDDPFIADICKPFREFRYYGTRDEEASFGELSKMDWKETPEAHVLKSYLPGVKKEEVKVEVENDNVVRVSGQKSMEKEETFGDWQRLECSNENYLRRFRLPDNSRTDMVKR